MASSVSSTSSSIGNTALRGFGGLASGLDRDALVEAMTQRTHTRVTEKEADITKLKWKQDAYRNLTDQILDMEDNFLSFSSGSSVKDEDLYEPSIVTAQGNESSTKYVSASGLSDMTAHIAISAVTRLATSATVVSGVRGSIAPIETSISMNHAIKDSHLAGKSISFGSYDVSGAYHESTSITMPDSYTETVDGKEVEKTIDYNTDDTEKLVREINTALRQQKASVSDEDKDNYLQLELTSDKKIRLTGSEGELNRKGSIPAVNISASTALSGLGFKTTLTGNAKGMISLEELNKNADKTFQDAYAAKDTKTSMAQYLKENKVNISFSGTSKELSLVNDEAVKAAGFHNISEITSNEDLQKVVQSAMETAFGKGKISVTLKQSTDGSDQTLCFDAADGKSTLTINASDILVRGNIGIKENESNRLTLRNSIWDNREKLGLLSYHTEEEMNQALANFSINGKVIKGLTADTSISDMLSKINNSDAGVKASYLSDSGRFILISDETGSGRQINIHGDGSNTIANQIFGGGQNTDGQDAEMVYTYGGTVQETVTSSTNTFQIDGLKVTVNGIFGGASRDENGDLLRNAKGDVVLDSSQQVTFTAKADTDTAVKKVKSFIEAFNKLAEGVRKEATTRPDKSYTPLTDDQKKEMSEDEIKKWEDKAKSGLLYGDSTISSLSSSLETVFSRFMNNGGNYEELKEIGISMSEDTFDGGKIQFDETKFRAAMDNDPDKVKKLMAGGEGNKGLGEIIEDILTPYATRYATRNGNSYGSLVKEAGSTKIPLSIRDNQIFSDLNIQNDLLTQLKGKLKTEQESYLNQFSTLETTISNLNSQSAYLSSLA